MCFSLTQRHAYQNYTLEGREATQMPEVLAWVTYRIVPGPSMYDRPALRDTRKAGSGESLGGMGRDETRHARTRSGGEDTTVSGYGGVKSL